MVWTLLLLTVTACESGDELFARAVVYETQTSERPDRKQALWWYRKAAIRGHAKAQYNLGCHLLENDPAEAVLWWQRAAEQGAASAQFNLGVAYWRGQGVVSDPGQSEKWWRLAAEQGHGPAQYHLAVARSNKADAIAESEAVHWYRRAARHGNPNALYALGVGDHEKAREYGEVTQPTSCRGVTWPARRRAPWLP